MDVENFHHFVGCLVKGGAIIFSALSSSPFCFH